MDNRTLLANLNLSQLAWGRLCGVNPRTAQRWFEAGCTQPVMVNRLLRFFYKYPPMLKAFKNISKDTPDAR